jgi:RNA polymerase sigma-70 factor (ECF subfamily)
MVNAASDKELVAKAARGDKDAYRVLVEKYQARVMALALAVVKNREDAEDITQESFVKAYLSLKEFKGQSSYFTWLYRIVYNMAIDFRRRMNRRGQNAVEYDENRPGQGDRAEDLAGGFVEGPQESILRKETGRRIGEVLNELSDEHRAVIMLREVDGLSYEQIAEVTGISKGTVMSRLHYARKKLQRGLAEHAPAGAAGKIPAEDDDAVPAEESRSERTRDPHGSRNVPTGHATK